MQPSSPQAEQQDGRICPRCHQLVEWARFARRSDGTPSWCRSCINSQRRQTNRRKRILAANEHLRRIRQNSPAGKMRTNLRSAARAIGGFPKLGRYLAQKMQHSIIGEACWAAIVVFKIMTIDTLDRDANRARSSTR